MIHLRVLRSLSGARLTGLAEADPARLAEARALCPDAAGFASLNGLLESGVDAVVICLPSGLHAAAAIQALDHGKHVYLEKPLAISREEGMAVLDAWRRSGRIGMPGFNFRRHPLYEQARQAVAAHDLGRLVGARSIFCSASRLVPEWKRNRAMGGGVLLDLATHHFDLARFVFGEEIAAVRATVRSVRIPDDTATVEITMQSGLGLQSFFSMSSMDTHQFEIHGGKGRLFLDRLASPAAEIIRPSMPYDRIHRVWNALTALHPDRLLRGPDEPSFAASLAAFVDSIARGAPASPDFEDGWRSLAAVLAAEESALHKGALVEVSA
jgi:myo-inositol 2-dehydrogenase/D-chiro-inositol 1-dehydrogenase